MADALLVSSSFLPGRGGIESFLAQLCADLAPRLAVLAPGRRDGLPLPQDLGYPAVSGPGRMLIPGARAARAIERAALDHGTTRVLFGTPWPLALLGPRLRRAGLTYGVVVHGAELLVPAAIPAVSGRLARALAGADLLLPVSTFTAERLETLLRKRGRSLPPIEVLRARVDLERFRPDVDASAMRERLDVPSDAGIVLYLGRLVRRKGVDRLIEALPAIARRAPGAIVVVAGTGPQERALRRRAARVGAAVRFAGRVADEDAPLLYAAADVFALPVADRWRGLEVEGLGVVLLEASAAGTPCVTGRSGGTPEAVLHEQTGFVVDARDGDALADRIAWLLEHRDRATAMGRAARAHVERRFSRKHLPDGLVAWLA